MARDIFSNWPHISEGPIRAVRLITPAAATDLPEGPCRGLLVATAGTLNFMDYSGETVTGFPLQAGYNAIAARQIHPGGTATAVWALY